MNQRHWLIGLLAFGLVLQPVPFQLASAEETVPQSGIHEFTLPSGQHLYIKEDHDQPIVTVDTWVTTGSVNETADNNGVSHFLEHLIFKGTDEYKTGEIDRLLESKGSKFNAATSDDYTHYYITAAAPFFEETLKMHASMLNRATIPNDELDRERKVVQEEINRATDNPDHKRFNAISQLIYQNHGYSLETLGPKENIAAIPRDNILGYYQYWYQPKNFHTIIVGDIYPQQAKALVEQYFSAKAATGQETAFTQKVGNYAPPVVKNPLFPTSPQVKVIADPSVSQAYLTLGFPAPGIEDRADIFPLDVAMSILGAGKSSRLYDALHEKKPLTLSVSAGNLTQKYAGILYIDAEMKPENREAVKQEILKQLETLKKNGVTAKELEKTKTQAIKDFIFHNEATDGVAGSIGYNVAIGKLSDYTDYVESVQKVTQADVMRTLNKYLDFNKAVMVELLPPGKATPKAQEEKNRQWLLAAAKTSPSFKEGGKPGPSIAATDPATADKVSPTREILANGLTLITKPLRDSQTVALKIFVRGGQSVEPVPGLSTLTAELLMSETEGRPQERLNQELESQEISVSVNSHEDYIEVAGAAISQDLGEMFLVLQDVLTAPAFTPAQIEKQKSLMEQGIQASRDNPSTIAMENFSDRLYPNHPYGNVGKRVEPKLAGITGDQIQAFYQANFKPENMVVSVVGNFDPATVKNYFSAAFPHVSTQVAHTNPTQHSALAPLTKEEIIDEKKPIRGATWIVRGWQVPPIGNKDYASLKVLNSYLGSGMSSRLFVTLREKQGLAYVVSSAYPTLAGPSNFFLFIGTDPKNRDTVIKGFQSEIDRLRTDPIDAKSLQDAKNKLKGGFALAHETNANQAFYLAFYETMGVGYQFDEQYPALIDKVTAESIQQVAQTYFSQPDVMSIVSPQDVAPPAPKTDAAKTPEKPVKKSSGKK